MLIKVEKFVRVGGIVRSKDKTNGTKSISYKIKTILNISINIFSKLSGLNTILVIPIIEKYIFFFQEISSTSISF